jgi:RNA polymerase sigma-70 factor (ECF subfamily)
MGSRYSGFDEFFDANYAPVVLALAMATGDRTASEEAVQEAFARALRRWSKVRDMDRPVGWIYVVAMNVVRRGARRRARDEQVIDVPIAHDATAAVATRVALRQAIVTLPIRQREAIVLRYLADLSIAETAAAMDCAPGTVKSAVHAALATLRVDLDDEEAGDNDARG